MSAIDELKNGANKKSSSNTTKISMVTGNKRTVVDSSDVKQAMGLPETTGKEADNPNTYIEDILDTENPNSMFMEHYNRKVEEAKEWIAEKREEEEEKAYEQQFEEEPDDETSEEIKEESKEEEVEEDLSNPVMTEGNLDNANVITMDIGGSKEDVEADTGNDSSDDFGVTLDSVEEEGITIDTTADEPREEVVINTFDDDEEEEKEESAEEEKKEEPKKESFTSNVNIEVNTSTEERKLDTSEEDLDEAEEDKKEEDDTEAERDENMKRLQKIVAERLKPASLGLDLSSFTVAKKAEINAKEIFDAYKARVSKWVAMNQESVIYMREFSGSELELLMEYYNAYMNSVRIARRYDTATVDTRSARQMYQMIYEHIEGPKPANFATWLKITPVSDIDNYFFAIYISSFMGANFIPVDCAECQKSYVTEDINIMDNMVKFPTQEARDKFTEIYNSNNPPATKGLYTSEIVPLTNLVAIGFKEPSIDDMLTINEIDRATQTQYSSILTFIPYIDNLYKIDAANHTLIPIDYKRFDSTAKTIRSKLRKYNNIFTSMGVDAFTPVKAYISALDEKTGRGIDYVLPETTCPDCGHVNPELPIGVGEVADMVFTRCQLGALVSTSIN